MNKTEAFNIPYTTMDDNIHDLPIISKESSEKIEEIFIIMDNRIKALEAEIAALKNN